MVPAGVGDEVGDVFNGVQGSSGPSSQPRGGGEGVRKRRNGSQTQEGTQGSRGAFLGGSGAFPARPAPLEETNPGVELRRTPSHGTSRPRLPPLGTVKGLRSEQEQPGARPPRGLPGHVPTARHLSRSCLSQNSLGPGTASNALTPQGRGTRLLCSRRSVEYVWNTRRCGSGLSFLSLNQCF